MESTAKTIARDVEEAAETLATAADNIDRTSSPVAKAIHRLIAEAADAAYSAIDLACEASGTWVPNAQPPESRGRTFKRELTLFDDSSTREKVTVMDKWEAMTDDARNPDFEGLEDFLVWGKRYRITIEEVGNV